LSYAKPGNTGLGSTDKTCAKVIKSVLDILNYPELRFDNPSLPNHYYWSDENQGIAFEHDCKIFRMKLFNKLRKAGWTLKHNPSGGLEVRWTR
jgi:hypothetical protein